MAQIRDFGNLVVAGMQDRHVEAPGLESTHAIGGPVGPVPPINNADGPMGRGVW